VVRAGIVENYVTDHHQKLFPLAAESAGQRVLSGHVYEAFSDPLPELSLRGPKLIIVCTHDPRSLLRAPFA
jgi:hypothetical protein